MTLTIQGAYVYIMSNVHRTVFYVGFTTNLVGRILDHKTGIKGTFTYKYNCTELVYYKSYFDKDEAQGVETRMKKWRRDWKINIIKEMNPNMVDLAKDWYN